MWCSVSFRLFIRRGLTCIFCSHAGVGLGTVASISTLHSTPSLKPWPSSARSSSQRLATHGPVSKGRHLCSTATLLSITNCFSYKRKWMFEKARIAGFWRLLRINPFYVGIIINWLWTNQYLHQLYFEIYLKWTGSQRLIFATFTVVVINKQVWISHLFIINNYMYCKTWKFGAYIFRTNASANTLAQFNFVHAPLYLKKKLNKIRSCLINS